MAKKPDPSNEDNFDFEDAPEDVDPFSDFPEEGNPSPEGGGADPFDFSEVSEEAAPPEPMAPKPPPPKQSSGKIKRGAAMQSPTPTTPPTSPSSQRGTAGLAADVPVQVVAVLGKKSITVQELVSFKKGQVVELNRFPNEAVDLVANGKLMAKGELVEIDGKLGVRIIKIFE